MKFDPPVTGLVPDHLGFRVRQRRWNDSAPNSPHGIDAPLPESAPAAPAPSPDPKPAIESAPPLALSPPEELAAGGAVVAAPSPVEFPPPLDVPASNSAKALAETLAASSRAAPPLRSVMEEDATAPIKTHRAGMHAAELACWRHACDWLQLHQFCGSRRCRHAKRCRGAPVACLYAGVPKVPQTVRTFARLMMQAQDLGLPFEEAFEDAADYFDAYEAWINGLAVRRGS
jgi:hypothetical protein